MDRLAVDTGAEVLELVEAALLRPPVVFGAPVLDQVAHVIRRYPVLPAAAVDVVREAALREPGAQVVQSRVVDADLERLDVVRHRSTSCSSDPSARFCTTE